MKKIIALLLLAVMCFSLVACGNKAEKEIVGTWKPSEESILANYTFVFNEDGTGTVNDGEMTWKYDDSLSCYIIASSYGELYCICDIMTEENGTCYFKFSGQKFYYQNN